MNEVAVVIPCFNLGRTLEEAVDSVLTQTRSVADIIVVDDGSTDMYTRQLLCQLRRPRTRIVHIPNGGVATARNHGVELSTAPYVVPLDADDLLEPTYVEKIAGCLDDNPDIDFVSCALQAFEGASYVWTPTCELVSGIVKSPAHATTMFRRRLFDVLGGFDPALLAFEPLDFWVRAIERGFNGRILPEPLFRYRIRRQSRYHKAIGADRFIASREALLRKHAAAVEQNMSELFAVEDAFLVELEAHRKHLEGRRDSLAMELAAFEQEQTALVRQLAEENLESVDWGNFRTGAPLGHPASGSLRQYYTGRFLAAYRSDITGNVLSDNLHLARWLGRDISQGHPLTWGDPVDRTLAAGPDTYDCVLLSEVSADPEQARVLAENALRVLKPGGVLFWIFPCLEPFLGGGGAGRDWRYTESAVRMILSRCFPMDGFEIESFGNVKVCAAALHGLGAEQLDPSALNTIDPSFPLVVCARGIKRLPRGDSPVIRIGRSAGTHPEARGAVLMYHKIATLPSDERHLTVTSAHFRAHMTHLRRHYHPMSLEDMARATRGGTLPDRAVAVTFDDGYLDALTTASPILTECGIPATFFLNTLDLDHENEFWGDTLERIFLEEPVVPRVLDLDLLGSRVRIPTGTAEERRTAWKIVSQRFYPSPADSRMLLLRLVVEWSGLELRPRETHRRMVRNEIVALAARSGHSIGAHTTHHLWLTEHSAQIQRQEITQNKTDLEQLLCRPVLTFAYPYGVHDTSTVEIARAAPFLCAVTVEPGLIHSGIDLLKVRRLEAPQGDLAPFSAFLEREFTAAVENKDVSGV